MALISSCSQYKEVKVMKTEEISTQNLDDKLQGYRHPGRQGGTRKKTVKY